MASFTPPWGEITDQVTAIDDVVARLAIETLTEEETENGKLMYRSVYRVKEPSNVVGVPIFDRFVIGTDEDPRARDPKTWLNPKNVAAKRLKSMLTKAGVPMTDMESVCGSAPGHEFVGSVVKKVEPALLKNGAPNQYAGRERNEVVRFWSVAEKAPDGAARAAGGNASSGMKAAARPSPKTMKCSICGTSVAEFEYGSHLATHDS